MNNRRANKAEIGSLTVSDGQRPASVTLITLSTIAMALVTAMLPAHAQEWGRYTALDDGFGVEFPGTPTFEDRSYTTALGVVLPARVYSASDEVGMYSVTVVDWRDSEDIYDAYLAGCQDCDEAMPNDIRGAALHAAFGITQRGGETTRLARSRVDGVRGVRIDLLNDDGSRTRATSYWHEGFLYVLEAIVAPDSPSGVFVDSISFIDQDSERVQYQGRYAPLFAIPPRSP